MRTLTLFLALILAASCADAQSIFYRKRVKADTLNYAGALPVGAVRDSLRLAVQRKDTVSLWAFQVGTQLDADTLLFTDSSYYSSIFNEGVDTLVITSMRGVLGHGIGTDTLVALFFMGDTLGDADAVIDTMALNSITTGNNNVAFTNTKIPPHYWAWCKSLAPTAVRIPTYLSVGVFGYRKR